MCFNYPENQHWKDTTYHHEGNGLSMRKQRHQQPQFFTKLSHTSSGALFLYLSSAHWSSSLGRRNLATEKTVRCLRRCFGLACRSRKARTFFTLYVCQVCRSAHARPCVLTKKVFAQHSTWDHTQHHLMIRWSQIGSSMRQDLPSSNYAQLRS